MEPFICLKPGTLALRPEARLLKAHDYQTVISAGEYLAAAQHQAETLLATAQHQAETLLATAQQEYARQQQRGYADGMNAAKLEMAEQLISTAERTVDYFADLEDQVAQLVMMALRKILGEFDDAERTLRVARNALQIVRNQPQVTIRVPPAQEPEVRQRLSELLAGFSQIGLVEVAADPRLKIGDCILETEIGVVDASLDVQLQAIERALKRRISTA